MINKKHLIITLIAVFISGFVAGGAIAPVIIHKITGNPYSKSNLAERVFNTQYLKNINLNEEQKIEIDKIIDKYVDMYKSARTSFSNSRNFIYSEFNTALSKVLTAEQFENYKKYSENEFAKRRDYRSKKEREASKEDK